MSDDEIAELARQVFGDQAKVEQWNRLVGSDASGWGVLSRGAVMMQIAGGDRAREALRAALEELAGLNPSAESLREIPPTGPDAIHLGRGEVGLRNAQRLRDLVRRQVATFGDKVAKEFEARADASRADHDENSERALRYAATYVRLRAHQGKGRL